MADHRVQIYAYQAAPGAWQYLVQPVEGDRTPLVGCGGFTRGEDAIAHAEEWAAGMTVVDKRLDPFWYIRRSEAGKR